MELKHVCTEIIKEARKKSIKDMRSFNQLKLRVLGALQYDEIPKNATIAAMASPEDRTYLKEIISMKPVRTISGVAPIALMTDPYPCPHSVKGVGPCTYCPGGPGSPFGDVPQSYTGQEPSTRRAIRNGYDPYLGVFNRLEHYVAMNATPEKTDVILQGGTFCFFPYAYQEYFVKYLLKAMNDFSKLFYDPALNRVKFNVFFELPASVGNETRTISVNKKTAFVKQLDLGDDKVLEEVNALFFGDTSKSGRIGKIWNEYAAQFNELYATDNPLKLYDNAQFPTVMKILLGKVKNHNNPAFSLEKIQEDNETAKIRCIGLTIETKSDYGKLLHGNQMLKLGCTRVEIGIQSIYNEVLEATHRGNTVEDNIESIRILKDLGFKINAHYMPGLPLTTKEMDEQGLKALFEDPDYKPDMLKLYPCMVLEGTKLHELYKAGTFTPMTTSTAAELIAYAFKFVPRWVRVMRVQRDIPTNMTEGGVDRTNLRQYVDEVCKKKGITPQDIRAREAGLLARQGAELDATKAVIVVEEYEASQGKEFFIEAKDEKEDALYGYCRLRFPSQFLREEITEKSALIREIHIYSPLVGIGEESEESFQHKGLGKKLMERAEEIAKQHGKNKMVVISGIGAREYFRKLGYRNEGPYVVKDL